MIYKKFSKKELNFHQSNSKTKFVNPWSKQETEYLIYLINNNIKSPLYIYNQKWFPKRTYRSLKWKIQELCVQR